MDTINNWVTKQQKKHAAFHGVYEALLGQNPFAYILYRLRYFFIVTLVGLSAHIVEFSLLYHFLRSHIFISLISFKLIFTLINGTWWGTLETMRERIRRYYESKKTREISVEITLWIIFGFALNVILILATLPISLHAWHDLAQGNFTLYDTYIVTILIQAICLTYTRTLHSGCLAIKRVYRPILSIISYEISSIIFIVILLPFIDEYSLPAGVFLGSLLNIYLSARYSMNMYRFLRIQPFKLPAKHHTLMRIRQCFSLELLTASASSLMMQIESVIVIILLFASLKHTRLAHASILIYFISPLIRASFDWVKLFYYDLKKFAHPLFALMVRHLNRYIQYTSYLIAAIFWIISFILSISFNLYDLPILLILIPFYLFRCFLAHQQMHRFTEMRYFDVIVSGAIAAVGIIVALVLHAEVYFLLIILSLFMLPAIIYLFVVKTRPIETDNYHPPEIGFYRWLELLKRETQLLCCYEFIFSKIKAAEHSRQFIEYVKHRITHRPQFTRLDDKTLLFFEKIVYKATKKRQHFYNTLTSGTIIHSRSTGKCKNGLEAMQKLNQRQILTKSEDLTKTSPERFLSEFPTACYLDLNKPDAELLEKYTSTELSEIFYLVTHFIKWPLKNMTGFKYAVSVQLDNQAIRYIYIIPKISNPSTKIQQWHQCVHYANVHSLLQ